MFYKCSFLKAPWSNQCTVLGKMVQNRCILHVSSNNEHAYNKCRKFLNHWILGFDETKCYEFYHSNSVMETVDVQKYLLHRNVKLLHLYFLFIKIQIHGKNKLRMLRNYIFLGDNIDLKVIGSNNYLHIEMHQDLPITIESVMHKDRPKTIDSVKHFPMQTKLELSDPQKILILPRRKSMTLLIIFF